MKAIKKNLKDGILNDNWKDVMMYCPYCGGEYSANSGDYFMVGDNHKFKCCGKTMELVRQRVTYQGI